MDEPSLVWSGDGDGWHGMFNDASKEAWLSKIWWGDEQAGLHTLSHMHVDTRVLPPAFVHVYICAYR